MHCASDSIYSLYAHPDNFLPGHKSFLFPRQGRTGFHIGHQIWLVIAQWTNYNTQYTGIVCEVRARQVPEHGGNYQRNIVGSKWHAVEKAWKHVRSSVRVKSANMRAIVTMSLLLEITKQNAMEIRFWAIIPVVVHFVHMLGGIYYSIPTQWVLRSIWHGSSHACVCCITYSTPLIWQT